MRAAATHSARLNQLNWLCDAHTATRQHSKFQSCKAVELQALVLGFQHETETDALAQLTEGATRYSLVVSGEW